MEKYYNISGINVCISGKDIEMQLEGCYLEQFESIQKDTEYHYEYHLVKQLPKPIGRCIYQETSYMIYTDGKRYQRYIGGRNQENLDAYMCVELCEKFAKVEVLECRTKGMISGKVVLNSLGIEFLSTKKDGFVFHASYILQNGKGILFTAPSGTGKSTQAELWKRLRGAEIINGDRVVVKMMESMFFAYGIPYAGSSRYCKNITAPLDAIVYLSQEEETKIESLKGKDAFCKILEGVSVAPWDRKGMEITMNLINNLIQQVPIYHLACTPDESAVIALENELRKEW